MVMCRGWLGWTWEGRFHSGQRVTTSAWSGRGIEEWWRGEQIIKGEEEVLSFVPTKNKCHTILKCKRYYPGNQKTSCSVRMTICCSNITTTLPSVA